MMTDQTIAQTLRRRTILATAVVPDPSREMAQASFTDKLHTAIGESVYLFDGTVLDPFNPVVVASFEDSESAVGALQKGLDDIRERNDSAGNEFRIRSLLFVETAGEGDRPEAQTTIRTATTLLASLQPGDTLIESVVATAAKLNVRTTGINLGGRTFFPLDPSPPIATPVAIPGSRKVAPIVAPGEKTSPREALRAGDRNARVIERAHEISWPLIAGEVAVLVLAGLAGWRFLGPGAGGNATPPAGASSAATTRVERTELFFAPAPTVADSSLSRNLTGVVQASREIFRSVSGLDVVASPRPQSTQITLRTNPSDTSIVPQLSLPGRAPSTGPPIDFSHASALVDLVDFIANGSRVTRPLVPADPAAQTAFIDAVRLDASSDKSDRAGAVAAIRAVVAADPSFLTGQKVALRIFSKAGDRAGVIAAARQITALEPGNVDGFRALAKSSFETGRPAEGIADLGSLLARNRSDKNALDKVGAYCLGAGDAERFSRVLSRMPAAGGKRLHKPDLLMTQGKVDAAAAAYYDLEASDPNDSELAWKIGRIAVLRRSPDIANLELAKLERSGAAYRFHLLKAYIAAGAGSRSDVESQLRLAEGFSDDELDFHTSSAELYALLNQPAKVIASLEKAIDRSEPTAEYVLRSPLFRYLESDSRFVKLEGRLRQQQESIRNALTALAI